jgi:hypothetical protein
MDMFSIQGARDVFKEAQKAFTALGAPENLMMVEDDAGHASTPKNRVAQNAFFQKYLNHPGDPKDEEVEFLDVKELAVTPTGQMLTSLKAPETIFSLNEKYTAEVLKNLQSEKQTNANFYNEIVQKAISLSGYVAPDLSKDYIFSGRFWRDECSVEKYLIKGPGDYYIPVLRLSSGMDNGKTVLLLDDKGKASAAAKGGLAEQLAQKGYQVIVPDLNGFGELSGGYTIGDAIIQGVPLNVWYAGILTYKSPLAVRVEDMKIIVDFIKDPSSAARSLTGIACGVLAQDLLHSAVINNEFDQIALIHPLFSYQSIVQEKNYLQKFVMSAMPGIIGRYDVPDLVTAICPRKICIINPVNSLDQMVDEDTIDTLYLYAKEKYAHSQNLMIAVKEEDVFSKLYKWLE